MTTNNMLADPYVYVVINNAFRKVVAKLLKRRQQKLKIKVTNSGENGEDDESENEEKVCGRSEKEVEKLVAN